MSGIAEVITAHWSRSTFTNHKPHVDKCDGCGAVIYTWGDDPIPGSIEPLATHQAEVLAAAGFGPVKEAKAEALREAAEHFKARSDTLHNTMQEMAASREYGLEDIVRYGAYSAEANTTATKLRARAALTATDQP